MEIFCSFCRNPCSYKIVNEGIGPYEYWGAPGNDKQLAVVSKCCRERCVDEHDMEITPDEIRKYEEYLKYENDMLRDER